MKKIFSHTYQQNQACSQRYLRSNSGQAMILTTLVLSSTVLALAGIGGYLMLIRLRVSSNVVDTTKAIYLADAGVECGAYNQTKAGGIDCNAATFSYNAGIDPLAHISVTSAVAGTSTSIVSTGIYNQVNRAFRIDF